MENQENKQEKPAAYVRPLAKPSKNGEVTPEMRAIAYALTHPEGDPYDSPQAWLLLRELRLANQLRTTLASTNAHIRSHLSHVRVAERAIAPRSKVHLSHFATTGTLG